MSLTIAQMYNELYTTADLGLAFDSDFREAFLKAPASSKYHHAYEGGLIRHCFEVYLELKKHHVFEDDHTRARIAILHDLCKVHAYEQNYTLKKTINKRMPYITKSENYGLGHGDLSLLMCERLGIELTLTEQFAIRWHMTSDDYNWKTYRNHIYKICPEIDYLKAADDYSAKTEFLGGKK